MAPPRPSLQACARKRGPSPTTCSLYRRPAISLLKRRSSFSFSLHERQLCRALPVQKQEIEGEEDEVVGATLIHCRLQPAEDRHAISIQRAQLVVEGWLCSADSQTLREK